MLNFDLKYKARTLEKLKRRKKYGGTIRFDFAKIFLAAQIISKR